jgi:alanine racemase
MAFTLHMSPHWHDAVRQRWQSYPHLVPVIKGNGYGFSRDRLLGIASTYQAARVAVGTIHEARVLADRTPESWVMTPLCPSEVSLLADAPSSAICTVGSFVDIALLTKAPASWDRSIIVKVQSSMRRYGVSISDVKRIAADAQNAQLHVLGYALHLPLRRPATGENLNEARALLAALPAGTTCSLSHLTPEEFVVLQQEFPDLCLSARIGTDLWLGDKSGLSLHADVIEVQPVKQGTPVGYRQVATPCDGYLVLITAGTAHGVQLLPNDLSPFHFQQTRLSLIEPPHMHTSLGFVPLENPCPTQGDTVEVQQPFTRVWPDQIIELAS